LGVFTGDFGNIYMGVKKGKPFKEYLQIHVKRHPEAEKKLEPLLGKLLKIMTEICFLLMV